jgi:hypothetical protein
MNRRIDTPTASAPIGKIMRTSSGALDLDAHDRLARQLRREALKHMAAALARRIEVARAGLAQRLRLRRTRSLPCQ